MHFLIRNHRRNLRHKQQTSPLIRLATHPSSNNYQETTPPQRHRLSSFPSRRSRLENVVPESVIVCYGSTWAAFSGVVITAAIIPFEAAVSVIRIWYKQTPPATLPGQASPRASHPPLCSHLDLLSLCKIHFTQSRVRRKSNVLCLSTPLIHSHPSKFSQDFLCQIDLCHQSNLLRIQHEQSQSWSQTDTSVAGMQGRSHIRNKESTQKRRSRAYHQATRKA